MKNKTITKKQREELATEIFNWLNDHEMWVDVSIYFNGKRWSTQNKGCTEFCYNEYRYFEYEADPKDYFEYVNEVGCEIWGLLCSIKEALNEPIGVWLPEKFIIEGTSKYVQGVEVAIDYDGIVPEGLDIITLPQCKMMIFQGEPFDDENYDIAIDNISKAIAKYNPTLYGYKWAVDEGLSFQMEPQGYRGYIEGHPVRGL